MNREIMQTILGKIKEYNRIIIFRHFRGDGDAVGSTKGLAEILRLTYPEKEVYVQNGGDAPEYLAFLGGEEEEIADELYSDALGIVIDTATENRIANKRFSLCRELIKIDHHIDVKPYGNYSWVEEGTSSACEMIAKFYDTFRNELKINSAAATYIYTGMVTDSGRFKYNSVSGDTLRYAGMLLDVGIDTETIYAHLNLKEFRLFKFESYVYKKMRTTENGVAYIHVNRRMQKRFNLSNEDASATVSMLDSIKGSIIWLALIDNEDGSIRVRLRSRFVTINDVAEKYHGGGHASASGATVYSKAEAKALLADLDAKCREYKESHEGWL